MIKFSKIILLVGIVSFSLLMLTTLIPLSHQDFNSDSIQSLKIYDRNGILLREIFNEKEGRGKWKKLNEISPNVIQAFIAAEDRRFYVHPGFDPLAIARAIWQNISSVRVISGGSTITQQVIRNVYNHPRTLKRKIIEIWFALRLENMLSKVEILEQYLNRVQFGNQTFGIESAARLYFDKPSKNLSLAEAAFLVGLPNAPSLKNPYRSTDQGVRRQQYILNRMKSCGFISPEEYNNAISEPLRIVPVEKQFRAPHFVEMIKQEVCKAGFDNINEVHTTLDLHIQSSVEMIVKNHLQTLKSKNVTNAAAVVIDNSSNEVIALVGSADYFDTANSGNVNGAIALRQPGSAIKPFIYALAFETGATPSDLIADVKTVIPLKGGSYIPENYDRKYHGLVSLRTALACSYNIPAVITAEKVGVELILQKLREAGFSSLNKSPDYYGLGLTLGNGEVTLLELTQAYSVFAKDGMLKNYKILKKFVGNRNNFENLVENFSRARKVFSEEASYLITDILSDNIARSPAFGDASPLNLPFPCAVKTGTTKDYRDNWTVGYTTEFSVGVWVGNFNGQPMKYVSGVSGAGQIFHDVIMLLESYKPAKNFVRPKAIKDVEICINSGKLAGKLCVAIIAEKFSVNTAHIPACDISHHPITSDSRIEDVNLKAFNRLQNKPKPLRIIYPNTCAIFKIDPILRHEYQTLKIQTTAEKKYPDVYLIINNSERIKLGESDSYRWQLKKGKHQFRLESPNAKIVSDNVEITVE